MREGWNIFRVFEPVNYVKTTCYWCGGSGKEKYYTDGICMECAGRGYIMEKKYPFHSLDNFIASLGVHSGATVKVTVEILHEPEKSIYLWNGQIKEGKELLGSQMER
jgi:DnaJ-class molecular chaperone